MIGYGLPLFSDDDHRVVMVQPVVVLSTAPIDPGPIATEPATWGTVKALFE